MAVHSTSHPINHVEVREDHDFRITDSLISRKESQDPQQQQQHYTSFLRTLLNGLNALSGVGLLSIPYALSHGGWLSFTLLPMIAIICCYTGLLLRRCMDADPGIKTYPDIGEYAFGPKGRFTVSLFLYLELYLVAIEFLILEGDNLHKLFPDVNLQIMGIDFGGKQGFVLLAALAILPTMWLRSLGLLAYVSAGGVLASVIVLVSVLWAGAFDGVGFHAKGTLYNLGGLPTTISLYAFCYCGHAVFPTIYTSMKQQNQFSKMLILCFVLCTINYGTMAVLGYLMYGEHVQSQVTLNLPLGKISSKVAIYTTLINPLTKFALMISPIAEAIEDRFQIYNNRTVSLLIRTLLLISTVIAALTVPLFAYLMALIGSFLSSTASMVLPCICYLKISKVSRTRQPEFSIIVGISVIGVLVAVVGTYRSLRQIAENL